MKNRIDKAFATLRKQGRKALIGYLTAGFPDKKSLIPLIQQLSAAGLDLIELGIPFSDPIADGPTIQQSSQRALDNGTTLKWILQQVARCRERGIQTPIIFMSYCNPIYAMGVDKFFREAAKAGVDGLIAPDLIPEESALFGKEAIRNGVHLIWLVAPTTPSVRLRKIARATRGFLYAVSLTGVTGERQTLPTQLSTFLRKVKAVSRVPVAVGFGLSTPQQVREASKPVDGVIVGSALIKSIDLSKSNHYRGAVAFVSALSQGLGPKKEHDHAS